MSHALYLTDPVSKEIVQFDSPHQMRGGTYAIGGTTAAGLNVTYNYGVHLWRVLGEGGITALYGKTGAETIPMLESAISQLGDDVSDDYWEATEGNAKQALCHLLAMAKMRPDRVWEGD